MAEKQKGEAAQASPLNQIGGRERNRNGLIIGAVGVGASTALGRRWHNVHPAAILIEGDLAVHEGEQRPIAPGADVAAGEKLGAPLAHDDAAGRHELAAIPFHTETFADAVASVTNAALTFLMSHKSTNLYQSTRPGNL